MSDKSYSRSSPSARYSNLIALYRQMHGVGSFQGEPRTEEDRAIGELCRRHGARRVLDYGAGKGAKYVDLPVTMDGRSYPNVRAYWGVQEIVCYDPAFSAFDKLPSGPFDGVVSTDVLEHIPEEDLPWVIDEMFRLATSFVYANVTSWPAQKNLPNGENAHCTIRPVAWWRAVVERARAAHPTVDYVFSVKHSQVRGGLSGVEEAILTP